jgi:diguanylate cyclase (GGDEF)-like protein
MNHNKRCGLVSSLVPVRERLPNSSDRKLRSLVQFARENEAKMRRFQDVELELMRSNSFADLLRKLVVQYRSRFALDHVTMAIVDPTHEIRHLLDDAQINPRHSRYLSLLIERRDVQRLVRMGTEPTLHRFSPDVHGWLFPDARPRPQSIAILPLERRGKIIGSLNLGSGDAGRFGNDNHADFLKRLAAVVGICAENTLNLERLRTAGLTDPLTGARNRRFLDERLFEEVARMQRSNESLAFLFVDIDHFKRVNDEFGHTVGDEVLREVAHRIAGTLRVSDVLTRYGGEEFAVLQPSTAGPEARIVAERIRRAVADEPVRLLDGSELPVTISVGVAAHGSHLSMSTKEQAEALTKEADAALYDAKDSGRNRVVLAE